MNFKAILDSLPISRTLELFLHQDDIALLAVALKYEWPSTSLLFQDILMWIPSRSASLAMAALSSFSYINDLDIPLAYTPYYQTPADGWDSLIQISKEYIYLKYICNEIGFGIFARKTIPRGKVVVPYLGELISTRQREKRFQNEYDQKGLNYVLTFQEHERKQHADDGHSLVLCTNIDATCKGNIARFINHACSASAVSFETSSSSSGRRSLPNDPCNLIVSMYRPNVADAVIGVPILVTTRCIGSDEQLAFDYGRDDVDSAHLQGSSNEFISLGKRKHATDSVQNVTYRNGKESERTPCRCNSFYCRKFLPCSR